MIVLPRDENVVEFRAGPLCTWRSLGHRSEVECINWCLYPDLNGYTDKGSTAKPNLISIHIQTMYNLNLETVQLLFLPFTSTAVSDHIDCPNYILLLSTTTIIIIKKNDV